MKQSIEPSSETLLFKPMKEKDHAHASGKKINLLSSF